MPATPLTDFTIAGQIHRTCATCVITLPLTPENFQHRADTGWINRHCESCRRTRDAENRRLRRQGRGVRAARRVSGRKFGIEIEYVGASREAVQREMRALGLSVSIEGYNHQVRSSWKLVTDASVMNGFELVSPPLSGAAGIDEVRRACQALAAAGAQVDRQCGLHVHHEIRDLTGAEIKRLVRGWAASQTAIDGLVAPSRRNGRWAAHFAQRELRHMETLADNADEYAIRSHVSYIDRYRALNLQGFPRYGTAEVRQHQGTTNAEKIIGWIHFGQALIERAKDAGAAGGFTSATDLLAQLGSYGLPADQAAYLTRRAARLAGGRVGAAV